MNDSLITSPAIQSASVKAPRRAGGPGAQLLSPASLSDAMPRDAACLVLSNLADLSGSVHALLVRIIEGGDDGGMLKLAARELSAQSAALARLALEAAENRPGTTSLTWPMSDATQEALEAIAAEGVSNV